MTGATVTASPGATELRPGAGPPSTAATLPLLSGRVANLALFGWLAGVLVFGRAFSEIGIEPFFLADLLAVAGAALSLPRWWPAATRPGMRGFLVIAALLAVLTAQSVYRGAEAGHLSALKSACMGVYPLVAVAIGGLVARDPELIQRFARRALPFVPLGSLLVGLGGGPYIAAAVGLYLACAAAWAVPPGNARRTIIAAGLLAGGAYLVGVGARRGPTLAIALAVVATHLAARRWARTRRREAQPVTVIIGCFSVALLAAVALLWSSTGSRGELADVPVFGPLVSRVVASTQPGTESGNNIALRWRMWTYALETTAEENPVFGRGAGQPVSTGIWSRVTIDRKTGVHNSFIGYAFYSGFPSAVLVVLAFALAIVGTWRRRALPGRASLFGAVLAVAATCMTNVALETPYIAGPAWAVVGAAVGAAAASPGAPATGPEDG